MKYWESIEHSPTRFKNTARLASLLVIVGKMHSDAYHSEMFSEYAKSCMRSSQWRFMQLL